MQACSIDNEFLFRHDSHGKLIGLMTIHVDDLKITGEKWWMQEVLRLLERVFGKLKLLWNAFTNCGVRHVQDASSKDICLDQVQYAQNLRPIAHPQLSTGQATDPCGPDLHQLYMSLLGAVA